MAVSSITSKGSTFASKFTPSKTTPTAPMTSTVRQGPVRPGDSESAFRQTGTTTQIQSVSGRTPTTSQVTTSSGGGSGSSRPSPTFTPATTATSSSTGSASTSRPNVLRTPSPLVTPAQTYGAEVVRVDPELVKGRQYVDDKLRDQGIDPTGKSQLEKVRLMNMASGSSQQATRLYLAARGITEPKVITDEGKTRLATAAEQQMLREDIQTVQPFKFTARPQEQTIRAAETFTGVAQPYQQGDVIYSGTTGQQLLPSQPTQFMSTPQQATSTEVIGAPSPSYLERVRAPLFPSAYGAEETPTAQQGISRLDLTSQPRPEGKLISGYSEGGKQYEVYGTETVSSGPMSVAPPQGFKENVQSVLATIGVSKEGTPIQGIRAVQTATGPRLKLSYSQEQTDLESSKVALSPNIKILDAIGNKPLEYLNIAEEKLSKVTYDPLLGPASTAARYARGYIETKITGQAPAPEKNRGVEIAFALPKSFARTVQSTEQLVTGRTITPQQGLDIAFTGGALVYGAGSGVVKGIYSPAESLAVKAIATKAPSLGGKIVKTAVIGTLGGAAAYSIASAPDPISATIELGADVVKYGAAARVGEAGGYKAARYATVPESTARLNLRKVEVAPYVERTTFGDEIRTKTRTPVEGERLTKNLLGQEFKEIVKGDIISESVAKVGSEGKPILQAPRGELTYTIIKQPKGTGLTPTEIPSAVNIEATRGPGTGAQSVRPNVLKNAVDAVSQRVTNYFTPGETRVPTQVYTPKEGSRSILYDIQKTNVGFQERVSRVEPSSSLFEFTQTGTAGTTSASAPGRTFYRDFGAKGTIALEEGKRAAVRYTSDIYGNRVPAVYKEIQGVQVRGDIYKVREYAETGKRRRAYQIPKQSVQLSFNPKQLSQKYLAEGELETFSSPKSNVVIQRGRLQTNIIDIPRASVQQRVIDFNKRLGKRAEVGTQTRGQSIPGLLVDTRTGAVGEVGTTPRADFTFKPEVSTKQGGRVFTPESGYLYTPEPIYSVKPLSRTNFLGVAGTGGVTRNVLDGRVRVGSTPRTLIQSTPFTGPTTFTGGLSEPQTITTTQPDIFTRTTTVTGGTPFYSEPPIVPPVIPVVPLGTYPGLRMGEGGGIPSRSPGGLRTAYQASLSSQVLGRKATAQQAKRLLSTNIFTGQEARYII